MPVDISLQRKMLKPTDRFGSPGLAYTAAIKCSESALTVVAMWANQRSVTWKSRMPKYVRVCKAMKSRAVFVSSDHQRSRIGSA